MHTKLKIYVIDPGCLTPAYDSELCLAMTQRGHKVTLVTAPHQNDPSHQFSSEFRTEPLFFRAIRLKGFPRVRKLTKGLSYIWYYFRLLKLLAGENVDAFHFQWLLIPPIDYIFIRKLKRKYPGAALVLTIHDVKPLARRPRRGSLRGLFHHYLHRALSMADGVIVHGEAAKQELLETQPDLEPQRIHTIGHGPLHYKGCAPRLSATEARHVLGLPEHQHIGVLFGEIKTYKGLDVLVQALAGLSENDRTRLTFVVAGKVEDSSCQKDLAEFVRLKLDTRMRLEYIPADEVQVYFRAADFAVLPYKAITQSGILMTALANGRVVVGTEVGELGHAIRATCGGWIVQPNDSRALREALHDVLATERDALTERGAQARIQLETQFGWGAIADKTVAVYLSAHAGAYWSTEEQPDGFQPQQDRY